MKLTSLRGPSQLLIVLGAFGFLVWADLMRIRRVEYLTGLAGWSTDTPELDPNSPTGYAGGLRQIIIPGHDDHSDRWIIETQQMLATNEWRIRRVDYDNAPHGRETHAPSLYRWWLATIAAVDHAVTGNSSGRAVESAAVYVGPVGHGLLLLTTVFFSWRRFGGGSAALIAVAIVGLYPFTGAFLPGAPDQSALEWVFAAWSLLPLLPAARMPAEQSNSAGASLKAGYIVAGLAGGLGLWINVVSQGLVLLGLVAGATIAGLVLTMRGKRRMAGFAEIMSIGEGGSWRLWGLTGAATCLAAYFAEYFPHHLTFQVNTIHPLYGVAWLGAGELMAQMAHAIQTQSWQFERQNLFRLMAGGAMLLSLPGTIAWTEHPPFFGSDPSSLRLVLLADAPVANSVRSWLAQDGITLPFLATTLPLLLLPAACVLIIWRRSDPIHRGALALTLGPVLVSLSLASTRLRAWGLVDAILLPFVVVLVATRPKDSVRRLVSSLCVALFVVGLVPGIVCVERTVPRKIDAPLSEGEVQSIVERDLAHWLARRAATTGRIVLTTPGLSTRLSFHGGLRGVASFDPENEAGLQAAVRISSASVTTEAQVLMAGREVGLVIVPSWDPTLDLFARIGRRLPSSAELPQDAFIAGLHRWMLPPWLHPVPYHIPPELSSDRREALVFEIVDEQNPVDAASRLAEFFVETNDLDRASAMRDELRKYPGKPSSLTALAQIEFARGDTAAFGRIVDSLVPYLRGNATRYLPFDRRINLAVVLAEAQRLDLAREQIKICIAELDEARLRSLSTSTLVRLLALAKAFKIPIPSEHLQQFALMLVPPGLRARL